MKKFKTHSFKREKYALIPAILMTLFLSGCRDLPQISAAKSDSKFPISGTCETTFEPPTFLRPPSIFSQTDIGTCVLSHLGKSGFYSVKEIDFESGTQITTEAVFTAANGDLLRAIGEGVSSPGDPGIINFNATLTFNGGTGRFIHASGSIKVEGQADISNGIASIIMKDGLIRYNASERSN